MKYIYISLAILLYSVSLWSQSISYPAMPTAEQVLWQNMEQTMFVHFAPQTWQGTELDDLSTPLSSINPTQLDVNQWIDVAESFGAKMIIFVAKHTGGFCWWQTNTTDYSIKNTPYKNGKGDVLDELAKACFDRGMQLGIYIYPGDETFGAYVGGGGKTKDPSRQETYNKALRTQWEEVLSRYGKQIKEIWYDGGLVVPMEDIIRKYTNNPIVFQGPFANIRWVGNEEGIAPYPAWNGVMSEVAKTGLATGAHGTPDGDVWMPLEVNTVLKKHYWFWSPNNYQHIKTKEELIDFYYKSVGRGGVALLNAAPDTSGLIPMQDVALYKAYGDEIKKRFASPLAQTSGKSTLIDIQFQKPTLIDHVILQEDIVFGERIRRYRIEGLVASKWKEIASGFSIGHKRIQPFIPVEVDAVRFVAVDYNFLPLITNFSAYYVGDTQVYESIKKEKQKQKQTEEHKVVNLNEITAKDGSFSVDLSPFIPTAQQYRVLVRSGKDLIPLNQVELWLEGVKTENVVWQQSDGSWVINCTAAPSMKKESIVIKAKMKTKKKNPEFFIHQVL